MPEVGKTYEWSDGRLVKCVNYDDFLHIHYTFADMGTGLEFRVYEEDLPEKLMEV